MTKPDKKLKPGGKVWRFDQIATNVNERIDKPSESGLEYYVGLEHLDPDSLKIRRWGSPDDVEATKLIFRKGDVIFGRRRAYQRKLGVAEFDGICSAHAMVLRAKPEVVLPEFLPFFLQSDAFMERAIKISVGSLSPTVNWKTLAVQEFVLPPQPRQIHVCEAMRAIDTVIEALKDAAQKRMKIRASLAVLVFTDASEHALICCKELIDSGHLTLQTGPFGTVLKASAYKEKGHAIINPVHMKDGKLDVVSGPFVSEADWLRLEKYWMREGDMVMGRKGDMSNLIYVGSEYDQLIVGSDCIRFRVNSKRINPRYFYHFLRSEVTHNWIQGQAYGTVMPGINEKILGRLVTCCPDLAEQKDCANQFDSIETTLQQITERSMKLMQVRGNLLHSVLGD